MFTNLKNAVHSTYVNTYTKFINPEGRPSRFLEDGTLTPEEVTYTHLIVHSLSGLTFHGTVRRCWGVVNIQMPHMGMGEE